MREKYSRDNPEFAMPMKDSGELGRSLDLGRSRSRSPAKRRQGRLQCRGFSNRSCTRSRLRGYRAFNVTSSADRPSKRATWRSRECRQQRRRSRARAIFSICISALRTRTRALIYYTVLVDTSCALTLITFQIILPLRSRASSYIRTRTRHVRGESIRTIDLPQRRRHTLPLSFSIFFPSCLSPFPTCLFCISFFLFSFFPLLFCTRSHCTRRRLIIGRRHRAAPSSSCRR